MTQPKLGSGQRFRNLTRKLEHRGVRSPGALAAYIGRKKYGTKRFAQLSSKGKIGRGGVASGGKRRYL